MNLSLHELALLEDVEDESAQKDVENLIKFLRNLQIESALATLSTGMRYSAFFLVFIKAIIGRSSQLLRQLHPNLRERFSLLRPTFNAWHADAITSFTYIFLDIFFWIFLETNYDILYSMFSSSNSHFFIQAFYIFLL